MQGLPLTRYRFEGSIARVRGGDHGPPGCEVPSLTPEMTCRVRQSFLIGVIVAAAACLDPLLAHAQAPELSMRDFSSGQIKKGVRSIGFGGDGATWGNYGLVWKDAGTALVDYGDTSFSNDNDFHFAAIGVTSPALWHDLAIYLIAMRQDTNEVHLNLKAPGFGHGATAALGTGKDDALFSKIAMPLGHGLSAGVLLSYETSHFDASAVAAPPLAIHYETQWRPSGGGGVAWQPSKRLLFGFRALVSNDWERRTDAGNSAEGLARSVEYRLGGSLAPWDGALIDVGGTRLERHNAIAQTHTTTYQPNVGFEQSWLAHRLTLRMGVDETSPTAGLSCRFAPFNLDIAYVRNMARARVGELFGTRSNSIVATFTLNYRGLHPGAQRSPIP